MDEWRWVKTETVSSVQFSLKQSKALLPHPKNRQWNFCWNRIAVKGTIGKAAKETTLQKTQQSQRNSIFNYLAKRNQSKHVFVSGKKFLSLLFKMQVIMRPFASQSRGFCLEKICTEWPNWDHLSNFCSKKLIEWCSNQNSNLIWQKISFLLLSQSKAFLRPHGVTISSYKGQSIN